MGTFNLADRYREAGLNPSADALGLRQGPFEKLRGAIDITTAVELTRLYFGFETPNGTEWFREPFHYADASFSMVDNKREAAVLAALLLEAGFADNKTECALAPLSAAIGGTRKPETTPHLLVDLEQGLVAKAIDARKHDRGDPRTIKLLADSKLPATPEAITQAIGGDWNNVGKILKQVGDESLERTRSLATRSADVINPLHEEVADLREEVGILWWHIGGWSRILDLPFSGLPPATAAALAGMDMSDLSRTLAGPAATRALLQRTVAAGRQPKLQNVTIKEAVDGLPEGALDKLVPHASLSGVPDICPVLTAFAKARDTGGGDAWHAAFRRASGLNETAEFRAGDLAVQVFRERQTLRAFE